MEEALYEEYARIEDTHWWFEGRRRIFDALIRDLELCTDARLLDMGCGTGTNLELLSRHGRVVGVDFGASAVRFARDRTRAELVRGDATRLPVASGSVDLVTALDLIEHLDDDAACVREIVRVCRPGGHVLVTVPAHPWLWGRQDTLSQHRRRYRAPELRHLLMGAGLELERFSSINTLLFPIVAAVRGFRRLIPDRSDDLRSDFSMTGPPTVNRLLARIFGAEAWAVRRFALPVGASLLCLARKPPVANRAA